jgi:hypothetical protein
MINRLKWYGLRLAERLGLFGLLAAVTSLFCLVFIFSYWMPTREAARLAVLTKRVNHLQVTKRQVTPAENLEKFFGSFPKLKERATQIQLIMNQAKELNLLVDDVSYKSEHHPEKRLGTTYVDFTLHCSYTEMRVFLNDILTDMPFVSLDQLSMSRDDENAKDIIIRMRLALHMVV